MKRLDLVAGDDRTLSVHLAAFRHNDFSDDLFAHFGIPLPPEIARSVPKRRQEFLYGRLAARQALMSLDPPARPSADTGNEIVIGRNREPLWPAGIVGIVGSISHCAGLAAAAVSRAPRQGLGIDIEHVITPRSRDTLLGEVVDQDEARMLRRLSSPESFDLLLTLVFSAKESLYKGLFATVGRYFGFEAAKLCTFDIDRRRMTFELASTLCDRFVASQRVEVRFEQVSAGTILTLFAW